jgi:multidrug efflux pump subunit AcrB
VGSARRERRRDCQSPPAADAGISGARINVNQAGSPLTRNSTRPLAIALGGGDYAEIVQWRDKVMQRVAVENPRILNLESDYLERQPRVIVQIDRNKAADLGVSLQTVGRTLETMMGSRIVTTFERGGEEYDVILQARDTQRASVGDLDNLYVRSDKNQELCRSRRWCRSRSAPAPPSCGARIACAPSSSPVRSRQATALAMQSSTWRK